MSSIILEGVLLESFARAKGSSEDPKRETARLQTLLRMIKKRKLLIFEKHQRKEPFLSEIAPFRCRIPYQCDT